MIAIMMAHCLGREDLTCFSNITKYRLLNAIQVSLFVIVLSNLVITYVYPEHNDFDATGLFLCIISMNVAYFDIKMTMNEFLETLGDIFLSQEARQSTQKPFWKDFENLKYTLLQHLALFFLIRWLQEHYGMEYAPQHVPFLLMGSANALIGLLGSTQCFDVIVIVELVMATMFAFLFRFFLFFPVIAAMMVQTSRRLETVLINPLEESGNGEEEAPPTRISARSQIKKRLESFRRRRQERVNQTSSDNLE
ncbi:unnamed protein product [Caenorhabditis nigoni]